MMQSARRTLSLCLVLLLVTSCVGGGANISGCTAADVPIRMTNAQIDALSDEQVKIILNRNEELADRGCARANK